MANEEHTEPSLPPTALFDQQVLPMEKLAVFASNVKVTSKLKDTILFQYHSGALEQYIQGKHNRLYAYNTACIKWAGMQSYMTALKIP